MTQYKARRVPIHRGPAAWSEILGAGACYAEVEGETSADIAIVGAGFAGLSAARKLTQLDETLRIAVIEAGDIAEGAAGRNSGFMIDIPHELTSEDYAGSGDDARIIGLNRAAISFGSDAVEDYEILADFFDRAGKINGAVNARAQAHNDSLAMHLKGLGEAYETLDAQAMTEVTGSHYYASGLYTPGTVMLQPAGYIRGLARGLSKAGVEIYEQSPVRKFAKNGASWTLSTAKGNLTAQKVILATNGHLESFGFARGRLMHVFLYAVMTPDLSQTVLCELGGQSRWGITPSDPMGTTVRRIDTAQGGNRIVTRTCATLLPGMVPSQDNIKRAGRVMQRKFEARFPALKGLKMQYAWAGHLCLSRNGVSVVREIDEGLYSACVQNGLGTARGTLAGIAAAEAALGCTSDIRAFFQDQQAPTRLPPRPFQDIGANALLRFREWQARSE